MPAPYFHLLGHVFLATEACEQHSSIADALAKAGFGKAKIKKGLELAEEGQALIDRKMEEGGEDRIIEHSVHNAADEVEMWHQTTRFLLKKAIDDGPLLEKTLGSHIHAEDHTVTVAAKALRTIAMIRTEPKLHEALGKGQKTRDVIIRGFTLLTKMFKNGDLMMAPGSSGDTDAAVFDDIKKQVAQMQEWVAELGRATDKMGVDQASLLGELGYVPEGVGIPLGGTAYGVPLHEKAQRSTPPDPDDVKPAPGWSIGRQGQNRENLGKGWVEPKFE
jgi:hypothetical protein